MRRYGTCVGYGYKSLIGDGYNYMPKFIELRASNAHRWMHCHGQPQAIAGLPNESNEAADRGTVAHSLLETMLRLQISTDEIDRFYGKAILKKIDGRDVRHITVDEDMIKGVQHALEYVRGYLKRFPRADYHVECALDATPLIGYECGGTGDVVITNLPIEIVVVDYKNGIGHVDHVDNDQLHVYGLGAIVEYMDDVTPNTKIRMVIVQPNSRNKGEGPVREVVYTYQDLMQFAKRAAIAAKAAYSKNPKRIAGDYCTFCRAAGSCRTYADRALAAAAIEFSDLQEGIDLANPNNLSAEEMATALKNATMLRRWLESVEEEAIRQLLKRKEIPGFHLVKSTPHRRWDDTDNVLAVVKTFGKKWFEELAPRMPLSPAMMDRRLRRKLDGNPDLLDKLQGNITRNPVQPKVAPLDDSREPYDPAEDFK